MSVPTNDLEVLQDLIHEETMYLRHYYGQVMANVDPEKKGKVLVTIPEIGLSEISGGIWCYPRDRHSMSVPNIKEYVEVYFVAGDPDRPVYMGQCNEMLLQVPKAFDGLPTTHVVFQNPLNMDKIVNNAAGMNITTASLMQLKASLAKLDASLITLNGGAEPFVLGTQLFTFLNNLVIWANSHVHTSAVPGNPTSPPTAPATAPTTGLLSTTILGK